LATLQQEPGVFELAELDADVRQDADGSHVGRVLFEELARRPLGLGQLADPQQVDGLDQLGVPDRGGVVSLVGGAAAGRVARHGELVPQRAPGGRVSGVQSDGFPQRAYGILAAAQGAESLPVFVLKARRVAVVPGQWFQQGQTAVRVTQPAAGRCQDLPCGIGLRIDLQDFLGLPGGKARVLLQQAFGVRQRGFQVSGICPRTGLFHLCNHFRGHYRQF
jgi:hypothetical protein